MNEFALALSFLTILPVSPQTTALLPLGRAARFFPLVGLLLGALLTSAHFVFSTFFNPLLAATLTVSLWALLTGGLHLDGLADCCDGLLAAAPPERRLEIMRDPRVGAFGAVGLSLCLIAKVTALATLPSNSVLFAVYGATIFSRWLIVLVAQQPLARPGGLAEEFRRGLSRETLLLATLLPAVLLLFGVVEIRVLIAGVLAYGSAWLIGRLARARLGGITGDVLGLTVEVTELVFLLTFAAQFSASLITHNA